MTPKERVYAALDGRAVDCTPVTVAYTQLYHEDHFGELLGRPAWEMVKWRYAPIEEHLRIYKQLVAAAPFDILQPQHLPSREERADTEFIQAGDKIIRRNRKTGQENAIVMHAGHLKTDVPNQTQYVFTKADVDAREQVGRPEQILAAGGLEGVTAAVRELGSEYFVLSGGVIGTLYSCSWRVGLTNLFTLLAESPDFIDYICAKALEHNIVQIRALAAAGGDGIYIDDATATSDMVSVKHYERFSLPYVQAMVREIHRLGKKAILIYFGGIADRLEQIVASGADGLLMEASMKNYVNDIAEIAERIGRRMTLFGNVNPVGVLQDGSEAELEAEVRRQVAAGARARGFILSTGSPVTPGTPAARVRRFIALAHGART